MADEPLSPTERILLIAVGAIIVETEAARREPILARIDAAVGNPRTLPIHDGDHLRMRAALRRIWEQLLPTWIAP